MLAIVPLSSCSWSCFFLSSYRTQVWGVSSAGFSLTWPRNTTRPSCTCKYHLCVLVHRIVGNSIHPNVESVMSWLILRRAWSMIHNSRIFFILHGLPWGLVFLFWFAIWGRTYLCSCVCVHHRRSAEADSTPKRYMYSSNRGYWIHGKWPTGMARFVHQSRHLPSRES